MDKLKADLNALMGKSSVSQEFKDRLDNLFSVYPFNEFEFLIAHFLATGTLSEEDYWLMRDEYIARNLYLYVFEISAPRGFGESWAQGHLKQLVPDLEKPTRKLDANYSGQYDFLCEHAVKIEVKASRAVDAASDGPLYAKALGSDSDRDFWMNFQQVKPACCDVFVLIAVWRDSIRYWVLSSKELASDPHFSKGQHRGNVGEGQVHFRKDNIGLFDQYEVESTKLKEAILAAYARQQN